MVISFFWPFYNLLVSFTNSFPQNAACSGPGALGPSFFVAGRRETLMCRAFIM